MRNRNPTDDPKLPQPSRRQRRAEALRKRALSPIRILVMVLALPVTTGLIAVGVYLRVTDYDRHDAVVHLIALAGCDATQAIGVGPFREGEAGYHKRNDPDGDGVACGSVAARLPDRSTVVAQPVSEPKQRMVGSAKFLKP